MGKKALYASIARGATTVVAPGVYIATSALPVGDAGVLHGLQALARQMRWPHLVASHETAVLVGDLPLLSAASAAARPPRFSRPPGPGVRSTTHPKVTVRSLPPEAVTECTEGLLQGLRVTTPARTALDLAGELTLPEALMLTDKVARQALAAFQGRGANQGPVVTPDGLSFAAKQAAFRTLESAAIAPIHGRERTRRVLTLTDPLRESVAESSSFGWFVVAKLPLPRCQVWLETESHRARVDFYWDDFCLVGECDGNVKYDGSFGPSDASMVQQNVREQALKDAGFAVVRWTAPEALFRPDQFIARVERRLRGCGWRGPV